MLLRKILKQSIPPINILYKVMLILLICIIFLSSNIAVLAMDFNNKNNYASSSPTQVPAKRDTPKSNTIRLSHQNLKLAIKKSVRIKVRNLPVSCKVQFHSSNPKIVTINKNGTVYGKSSGTTMISANILYKGRTIKRLSCQVQVGPRAISITAKSKITLSQGECLYLNAIVKPKNTIEVPIYTVKNPSIVVINKEGLIIAKKVGQTIITSKIKNGKSKKTLVVVTKVSSYLSP